MAISIAHFTASSIYPYFFIFFVVNWLCLVKRRKVLVHHAALLQDGTVWTWGYNNEGNCGVADLKVISEPTMVAEDVVIVLTDLAVNGYPEPNAQETVIA